MRCSLVLLNIFYIVLSLFLIGVVIAAKTLAYFGSVPILVGIAVCGAFLWLTAILGLVGTIKHHQVTLFFYMIILALSGIVMFSVSVAALALPRSYQESFFLNTWKGLGDGDKSLVQDRLDCCGFDNVSRHITSDKDHPEDREVCRAAGHPSCNTSVLTRHDRCCSKPEYKPLPNDPNNCTQEVICPECDPCYTSWEDAVSKAVTLAGGFGLVFSLTEVIGIVLTCRYRNLKDPNANPSAFL